MIAELAALALTCAANIHPDTLYAVIRHESRERQYAIGVNQKGEHLPQQPQTLAEATAAAERLIDRGIDFDAGLGQINVRNWAWLNLDSKTVFDPCRNLAAAQAVLSECYARALPKHRQAQQALRAALSCYNTGNFTRGFTNGYVDKVLAQANIKVPALIAGENEASQPTVRSDTTKTEPSQQSNDLRSQDQGTQDGFMTNPAIDGFSQKDDRQPSTNHDAGA